MNNILFMLLALFAGAVLPVQAGLNTKMGHLLHSPVLSSFISFIIGAVSLLLYMLAARIPLAAVTEAKNAPAVLWLAGLLGAFYVTSVILLVPRLGVALTFGLVVSGQMLIGILMDHFGWLGVPSHPVSVMRIAGALLLVAGVILIRKF